MACIITMNSKELLTKFITKYDYRRYNFLLISENVKSNGQHKNVYSIPSLIPPPNIISTFITEGYGKTYANNYIDYISTPRVESMITIAVKLATMDKSNVIFLCSKDEEECKYMHLISQYIQTTYKVPTFTFEQYNKNPKKCEMASEKINKKTIKILEKKISAIKNVEKEAKKSVKNFKEYVKKLDKDDLKALSKQLHITDYKKYSTKKLRKKVIEAYSSKF